MKGSFVKLDYTSDEHHQEVKETLDVEVPRIIHQKESHLVTVDLNSLFCGGVTFNDNYEGSCVENNLTQ